MNHYRDVRAIYCPDNIWNLLEVLKLCAYLSNVEEDGQLMNFLSKFFFIAVQNWETAS